MYWVIVSFVGNRGRDSNTLLEGRQKISVHAAHVLSDLDKILYKRWPLLLLSICQFRENRPREGRSFLMDVNGITFTVR